MMNLFTEMLTIFVEGISVIYSTIENDFRDGHHGLHRNDNL